MINLIVADDHNVLRQALCEMLENQDAFKVIAQAKDGEEVLSLIQSHHPDIVIMDVAMPKLGGIEALELINKSPNPPPVLILSANENEMTVRAALKAGAKGFVPKNITEEELAFAIDAVVKGQTYLSPSVTSRLMSGDRHEGKLDDPLGVLTKRETEILKHLAEGLSNREIGKKLFISTRTVDTHRSNILKKLKVKTNAQLVKMAISNGLIHI